ncbi:MAG TPA: hypothetical protein VG056_04130 [Pirellulales bacterium]|jgi:hypothetical protein|nr:hypothetical protein [Pirellulales bacterium]
MNDFSPAEHSFDPQTLDRLVDGELAETERRDVLQSLDQRPDGWRQCALAFLEAQSWGQTLTRFARNPGEAASSGAPASAATAALAIESEGLDGDGNVPAARDDAVARELAHHAHWRWWMAMAGSFLVTFSLGMYAQRYFRPSSGAPEAPTVTVPGATATNSGPASPASGAAGGVQEVEMVMAGADGRLQRVKIPVLVDSQAASLLLQAQTAAVPDDVRQALARMGSEPRVQRELWPVQVGDRKMLVPFDRVEIVPVRGAVQ